MDKAVPSILSDDQVRAFRRDGFLVVRALAPETTCNALISEVERALDPPLGPLELEAELGYPGSPGSVDAVGGKTPRRLLHAYSRGPLFRAWAGGPEIRATVPRLIGRPDIVLEQSHHNCIMTKFPRFGSETGWHQDIRYWSFAAPDLINAWLALGTEGPLQGGLSVVPGSHRASFAPGQFDAALFFRSDLPENQGLLQRALALELQRGDVLFFHCRLLHAGARNLSDVTRRSLVFTYNRMDNPPTPGSRSARLARIGL